MTNECRNSTLMTIFNQIRVVTCHQYGICALIPQTSFHEENSEGIAKYWLFSQVTDKSTLMAAVLHIFSILGLDQFKISLGELSTYPSPNTTFCPKREFNCQHSVRGGVGQEVSQNLIMIRFSSTKKLTIQVFSSDFLRRNKQRHHLLS